MLRLLDTFFFVQVLIDVNLVLIFILHYLSLSMDSQPRNDSIGDIQELNMHSICLVIIRHLTIPQIT